jgi:hypothetical protein
MMPSSGLGMGIRFVIVVVVLGLEKIVFLGLRSIHLFFYSQLRK